MQDVWLFALLGGALIGAASALLFLTHGRIAGISGIAASLGRDGWRIAFLAGLVASGLVARLIAPSSIGAAIQPMFVVAIAGLLVGIGTNLGNGCTSGHGVCGISRLSLRSLVAVPTFILTGVATVWLVGGAR